MRRRRHGMALACAAAVVLGGCGAGDAPDAPVWTGTRDTLDGVEVVRNPAEPLYDSTVVELERLWTAPTAAEEERRGVWEQPATVREADGRVYVLDRLAHHVYALDAATGEWLRTIGRRGGGPGEVEGPFGPAMADGRVVIGSAQGQRLVVFDTAGTALRTVPLNALALQLRSLAGGRYLLNAMDPSGSSWHIVAPNDSLRPYDFPVLATADESEYGFERCRRISGTAETVLRLSCIRPSVVVADLDGRLVREVHIDRAPEPPSTEDVEARLDRLRDRLARMEAPAATVQRLVDNEREAFRWLDLFRTVRADPTSGRIAILEQPTVDMGGGPAVLHLLSRSGVYLARVGFDRSWEDFELRAGELYALVEDDATGLVHLTAYRYRIPDTVPVE